MFEQAFTFADIPRIFTLGFLEILLSADNAVVLGVLSRALPLPQRQKALFIGIGSSFILRAGALLLVGPLLQYTWIQLLGAAYLLYLSIRYFIKKGRSIKVPAPTSFWKTVLLIEVLDLVFAFDSIVAGIAFIDSNLSKLWIVYAGGMIGLIGMRYAATFFSRLLDSFPRLETSAYSMVGLIGIKLAGTACGYPLPSPLFWGAIVLLFLLGFFKPTR